jgi:hypothetical protein
MLARAGSPIKAARLAMSGPSLMTCKYQFSASDASIDIEAILVWRLLSNAGKERHNDLDTI